MDINKIIEKLNNKLSTDNYETVENDLEYSFLLGNTIQVLQKKIPTKRNKLFKTDMISVNTLDKLIKECSKSIFPDTKLSRAIVMLKGYKINTLDNECLLAGYLFDNEKG